MHIPVTDTVNIDVLTFGEALGEFDAYTGGDFSRED